MKPPRPPQPVSPPPSAGKLGKIAQAYAARHGLAIGRVRDWISYMMLSAALERATRLGHAAFVIKGGVALELRLKARARATNDLDLVVMCMDEDPLRALDVALAGEYEGFAFARKPTTYPLGPHGVRVWVTLRYHGQSWATVQIDVTRAAPGEIETAPVPGIPLSFFGLREPESVRCLSLRFHLAEKLHAMTAPTHDGHPSDRFRDLADSLLLRELVEDYAAVREACEHTFRERATHEWPPALDPPAAWAEPYTTLAQELALSATSFDDAIGEIKALIQRIAESR